jgi:hypothetical protein
MKRSALVVLLLIAAPLFAQQAKPPELQFHSTPDFLKLPEGVYFGECVGVALCQSRSARLGPAVAGDRLLSGRLRDVSS